MKLIDFLKERKDKIVKTVEVAVPKWSHTYPNETGCEDLEVIDFDSLMKEISEFEETFKDA